MTDQQPVLLYFFDPLCGWCYGFSDVMHTFYQKHQDEAKFRVVLGGMITGEREGPIGEFADYILNALPQLQEKTGAEIGDAFIQALEDRSLYQSSIQPSLAIAAVRSLYPDQLFEFIRALQQKQFIDGSDLQGEQPYRELAKTFDWNPEQLITKMQSDSIEQAMRDDFNLTQQIGVQGFPTLIGKSPAEEQFHMLTHGYTTLQQVESAFQAIVANQAQ